MSNPEPPTAESALHEYMDAEFYVSGLDSPQEEQRLGTLLDGLAGVQKFSFHAGKVTLEYEPAVISKARISEQIEGAGFHISEAEVSSASPIIEAITEQERGNQNL